MQRRAKDWKGTKGKGKEREETETRDEIGE